MNEDLEAIEKEIKAKTELQEAGKTAVPVIPFESPPTPQPKAEQGADKATALVEEAFSQAIIHKVATDEAVQNELLDSAGRVIKNKTNAIKERADQEEKEAHFNNKKSACGCFGEEEKTTGKWAVNYMNAWHNVMLFLWITIGCFTFAPVTFVAQKIKVIFKKSWVAVTLAIIIYLFVVVGIPLLTVLGKKIT